MIYIDLLLAALATWQIVEIIRHGEIFDDRRAVWAHKQDFASRVLRCPFCLSVWVGTLTATWVVAVHAIAVLLHPCTTFLNFWVYGFAVSRLANLCNDTAYPITRTPKEQLEIEIDSTRFRDDPESGGSQTASDVRHTDLGEDSQRDS